VTQAVQGSIPAIQPNFVDIKPKYDNIMSMKPLIKNLKTNDGKLTFSFMPYLNDFAEKTMFSRWTQVQVPVCDTNKYCKCTRTEWRSSTEFNDFYVTKYKRLSNDLLYVNIWELQFELMKELKFCPLEYQIDHRTKYIKMLNFTIKDTSNDGWFEVTVNLNNG
jgi:hypothetical protein